MARKEFETLTPQMYYILLALCRQRHGYEIMTVISAMTENTVQVGAGTLYALLPRFLEDGFIRLVSEQDRKKIYVITPYGKKKLAEETEKMKRMLKNYEEVTGND